MRRVVKRILKWAGIVLGVLLLVLIAVAIIYSVDEAPPNDADLRIARLNVPDEENAFTYFRRAAEKLSWPEERKDELTSFIEGKAKYADEPNESDASAQQAEPWDAKLVDDLLAKNDEVFGLMNKGLACSKMEWPKVESFGASEPYMLPLRDIGHAKALRSISLMKAGKPREAIDEALSTIKLGHMVGQSGGHLLVSVIGGTTGIDGYQCLNRILGKVECDDKLLRNLDRALETMKPDKRAMTKALKCEYALVAQMIDEKKNGELSRRETGKRRPTPGFLLRPNATKRVIAQSYRQQIENLSRMPSDYIVTEVEKMRLYYRTPRGTVRLCLEPNFVGKVISVMLGRPGDQLQTLLREQLARHSTTRLMIALKRCKMKTGSLPDTLDALVPDYVDKVPDDPFDGKPMRYDPKEKIIYSVGDDLKDDGGDSEKDEVYRIRF